MPQTPQRTTPAPSKEIRQKERKKESNKERKKER
jgi:hypothetical protein